MFDKLVWTEAQLALFEKLTRDGVGHRPTSRVLGMSEATIRKMRKQAISQRAVDPNAPLDRTQAPWPLPAGHPETWGAITRNTCLEGQEYSR